jgi:hypothetical protein
MLRSYLFWLRFTFVVQLICAGIHSISLFIGPQPETDTERQMLDLMSIKNDMGAGFNPSMLDFFLALSSCFTFLYLLGGLINLYLVRRRVDVSLLAGIVNINLIVFTPCFLIMTFMTFLPPVILTGLVTFGLIATRLALPKG